METKYEYNVTEKSLKIIKGNERFYLYNVKLLRGNNYKDKFFVYSTMDLKSWEAIAVIDNPVNIKLIL